MECARENGYGTSDRELLKVYCDDNTKDSVSKDFLSIHF